MSVEQWWLLVMGRGRSLSNWRGILGWRDTTKASHSPDQPCPDILIRLSEVRANSPGPVTAAHRGSRVE